MVVKPAVMRPPNDGASVPNPDPTERTVEQLLREIGTSREILETKINGNAAVVETRLGGMDKAIELLQKAADRIPGQVKDEIAHLKDLHQERITGSTEVVIEKIKSLSEVTAQQFKSIADQFAEKDKAVSVGLSAQKESAAAQQASNTEATTKMESNFTKLLDQGRELLGEFRRNTELQINDLKASRDKGDGKTSVSDPATVDALQRMTHAIAGLTASRDESTGRSKGASDFMGWIVGAAGLAAAVTAVVVNLAK